LDAHRLTWKKRRKKGKKTRNLSLMLTRRAKAYSCSGSVVQLKIGVFMRVRVESGNTLVICREICILE